MQDTQQHGAVDVFVGVDVGKSQHHAVALDLLERYPSPAALAAASEKTLANRLTKVAPEVEQLVLAHPLWPVLTSMPGVGVRTAARLLTEVAHKAFASAAHLAAYAGLAPVTRRSGSRYVVNTHPDAATRCLSAPCSCLPSRHCETPSHGPITRARSSKASATTKPSSHWHGDAATSCSPCCVTAPFTNPGQPLTLDETHRPPRGRVTRPRPDRVRQTRPETAHRRRCARYSACRHGHQPAQLAGVRVYARCHSGGVGPEWPARRRPDKLHVEGL